MTTCFPIGRRRPTAGGEAFGAISKRDDLKRISFSLGFYNWTLERRIDSLPHDNHHLLLCSFSH